MTDKNINFVEKALIAGFISNISVNPRDNFFGASLYHPEITLNRDNKEIHISLNKEILYKHHKNVEDGIITTSTYLGSKYISLKENGKCVY